MIILGIHDGPNASAALVKDGELIGFSRESRHRREGYYDGFPSRGVRMLLADADLEIDQIDAIAMAGHVMKTPRTLRDYLQQFADEGSLGEITKSALSFMIPGAFRAERRKRERLDDLVRYGFDSSKATFVDSHLASSMLAYAAGPGLNRRCLVLCAGVGADRMAASVHVAQNGKLERIASVREEDSLGALQESVTYMLGLAPQREEPLLMALGSRTSGRAVDSARKRFELLFEFDELLPLNWQASSILGDPARCQEFLRGHFRRRRFDHIAGGWYTFMSKFISDWIGRCAHKTEIRDVVVCGDLFEIGELIPIASRHRDVHTLTSSPLPGLAGNAIGAALLIAAEKEEEGAKVIKPITTPYYGNALSESVCDAAVMSLKHDPEIALERPENLAARVAELLAAGALIARVSGKEDMRLKGLGNRSLIARADHAPARERLAELTNPDCFWANQSIFWQAESLRGNFREADTLPEAACGEFFLTPRNASPWYGLHEDKLVPVQSVPKALNQEFWDLQGAFVEEAGRTPLLCGAWRNRQGQLVRTAKEAVRLWRQHGLSGLVLGPWLAYRRDLSIEPPEDGAVTTQSAIFGSV